MLGLGQPAEVKVLILGPHRRVHAMVPRAEAMLARPVRVSGPLSPPAEPLSLSPPVPQTLQVTWYLSLSPFLLSLLFASKALSYTFQIATLQKLLSHLGGHSFPVCDHPSLASLQKEL